MVEANELGFPGPLYPQEKWEGVYRIFVTGDAFESAEGVDTKQAWPRILENRMNEMDNRYQVMNFSITGWGPNQYEAVIREYAQTYRPNLIVIGFYVNEYFDVRKNHDAFIRSIGFEQPSQESIWSYLHLVNLRKFIKHKIDRFRNTFTGEPYRLGYFLGNFNSLERNNVEIMLESSLLIEGRLRSIKAIADNIGARVLVVMVPAPVQICGPDTLKYYPKNIDLSDEEHFDRDQPQRLTQKICKRTGIEYLDLRPALKAAADGIPYQQSNMHWTKFGHEVVAKYMSEELSSRGFLD